MDELEAGALVDAAGGGEHALGPERDLAVARIARKAQSLLDQPGADAEPARLGLDQQEAQPRDILRFPHQQDRADILALALAIQQRSRLGSWLRTKAATISAVSASRRSSQPYSSA